jgi:eukaryotic-like serine/threonine-protein kinase
LKQKSEFLDPMYLFPLLHEVIAGQPATPSADLYAVGIMMFEMFTGQHPHFLSTTRGSIFTVSADDVETATVPLALRELILKLLAQLPGQRFNNAIQVLDALRQVHGVPFPSENFAGRFDTVYSAPFIGRSAEIKTLTEALTQTAAGQGNFFLVAGESGVGKSRLLSELNTHALVQRMLVLRGQAIGEGSLPYLIWREPLRQLALINPPSRQDASILKEVAPDLESLVGSTVIASGRS